MRIAIDAMGGDNAPEVIVKGTYQAAQEFQDMDFVLYGNEQLIKDFLPTDLRNIEIVHTLEKIGSSDEPVKSIRTKKQASMVLAAHAVKNGEVDALLSAGNTGALLASGLLIVGRIKGIDRPGLLTTIPTLSGPNPYFILFDSGANADTKPVNLQQFSILGSAYAEHVLHVKKPRVGLLNNGTEASKGSELTKAAYELLSQEANINFIGNVEARDLLDGVTDVVVADGFTGNAVLKSIEGTVRSLLSLLKNRIKSGSMKTKLGGLLIKGELSSMKENLDYNKAGGGVLFGVKSPVIKMHGSANEDAVYYTIKQTRDILESNVISTMVELIENEKKSGEVNESNL